MGDTTVDGVARRRSQELDAPAPPPPVRLASEPAIVPFTTTSNVVAQALLRAQQASALPPLGDLSLYTADALEREIAASRARAQTPGEAELRGVLEREFVKRLEPPPHDVATYATRADVETSIAAERDFLKRAGGLASPELRARHEAQLDALLRRRFELALPEIACEASKPTFVTNRELPAGAHMIVFGADDLVASLRAKFPLSKKDEAQIREAFRTWRGQTCARTGTDPTTFVDANKYAAADVDHTAEDAALASKYLELIESMTKTPLAAAAFFDSALRNESLDATLARVRGAMAVSGVTGSLVPARLHAEPSSTSDRTHTEVAGEGQRLVDERNGAGHAQNTRFRGEDLTGKAGLFPEDVTYGGYRPNPGKAVRTVDEARAEYERVTGRKIPPWVKIVVDDKMPDDRDAMYVLKQNATAKQRISHEELVDGGVVVRLRSTVLGSDESIVGHLTHELFELENLERILAEAGGALPVLDVRRHIAHRNPTAFGGVENLHGQAWDVADVEVQLMRARADGRTNEIKAYETRRDGVRAKYERQNHGS